MVLAQNHQVAPQKQTTGLNVDYFSRRCKLGLCNISVEAFDVNKNQTGQRWMDQEATIHAGLVFHFFTLVAATYNPGSMS